MNPVPILELEPVEERRYLPRVAPSEGEIAFAFIDAKPKRGRVLSGLEYPLAPIQAGLKLNPVFPLV